MHQDDFSKFSSVSAINKEKESFTLACIRSFYKVFLCVSAIYRESTLYWLASKVFLCVSSIYREKGLLRWLASEVFFTVFLCISEKESYTGLHQKFSQSFLARFSNLQRKSLLLWLASEVFTKFSCVYQQYTEEESIVIACVRSFHRIFLCLSAIHRGRVYCYCMCEKFLQSFLVSFSNTQRKSLLLLHV